MISGTLQSGMPAFQAALQDHFAWSKKSAGAALDDQGRKLSFALYRAYRARKPAKGSIRAEAEARQYRIRVRQSIIDDVEAKMAGGKTVMRGGKRLDAKALAVEREIALRERSIGYLSVTWLMREWSALPANAPEGRESRFEQKNKQAATIGIAELHTQRAVPEVRLIGQAKGVTELDSAEGIVAQALEERRADMEAYVHRKQMERASKVLLRQFRATPGRN